MTTADGIEVTDPQEKIWYICRNCDGYPRSMSWASLKYIDQLGERDFYSSKAAVVDQLRRETNELWEEHGRLTEWISVLESDVAKTALATQE